MDDWQFVFPDHHRGYIDWDRVKANQVRLTDNAQAYAIQRRSGPVREGSALLQGRVLCGLCGERMGVRYSQEHGQLVPTYMCQETTTRRGGKLCQSVPGKVVDPAIGALLVELMTPMTLEVSLAVQSEIEARFAETDAMRRQHIERTRYEAELARRRYMKVDPDNRLVADALEAEWNEKLRLHTDVVEDYERRGQEEVVALDAKMRRHILALAEQFPRIWADPRVDVRERKRILRFLVADVTLIKAETITAHVRLSGGATRTLTLNRPLPIAQIRKFKPELVAEVDQLLDKQKVRNAADRLDGADMGVNPICQRLRPTCPSESEARRAEHGDEDLRLLHLARQPINQHWNAIACVIDKQSFARRMRLAHRRRQFCLEGSVKFAERE